MKTSGLLDNLVQIDSVLIPSLKLDVYGRGLYIHLLCLTIFVGVNNRIIHLKDIATALACSIWQARKTIRILESNGLISLTQTRTGYIFEVIIPRHQMKLYQPRKESKKSNTKICPYYSKQSLHKIELPKREVVWS